MGVTSHSLRSCLYWIIRSYAYRLKSISVAARVSTDVTAGGLLSRTSVHQQLYNLPMTRFFSGALHLCSCYITYASYSSQQTSNAKWTPTPTPCWTEEKPGSICLRGSLTTSPPSVNYLLVSVNSLLHRETNCTLVHHSRSWHLCVIQQCPHHQLVPAVGMLSALCCRLL